MKKILTMLMALIASLTMVASAQADGESVRGTTEISGVWGSLYQSTPVPANLKIRAEVTAPEGADRVLPMKNTKVTFPDGVSFNPNNALTPACTDSKLNLESPLGSPSAIVGLCPKSVVGTGTATILLAKLTRPMNIVEDPILVIFNAGSDDQGRPKIKIYGYSLRTKVGILMNATLINGVLDVAIPVLSNDSAVKWFEFDIPGKGLDRADIGIKTQGYDKNYVKALCPASGSLLTKSEFILGERDPNTSVDSGPESLVVSEDTTQDCTGMTGTPKPKLTLKVKGPKSVKNRKKGAFKVTVKNTGALPTSNVRVTTAGAKAAAGVLNPGRSKTVTLKLTIKGKKGKSKTLTFTAKGGVTAKAKAKVKIK